eukprot:jgi/Botrbrau1/10553/Bobra.0343s0002.1
MNNNKNDEGALLGVFGKTSYITIGNTEDPLLFKDGKQPVRDNYKGKQMMTRPALLGRTPDSFFGKKHLYVAEGCPFVDRVKYQETQKSKPKKGFHTSDYSRRDEFTYTFRTEQYREQLKTEGKQSKATVQMLGDAPEELQRHEEEHVPKPEVFLYDLVVDTDNGGSTCSKLARDTRNPTALSHDRKLGTMTTTSSRTHCAFQLATPFTKPAHVHKPVIRDTFYRRTNVFFREGGTAVAAT